MKILNFIPQNDLSAKKLDLTFDDHNFFVVRKKQLIKIQNAFLSVELRNISSDTLDRMLEHGYLSLKKLGKREYSLRFNGRVLGAGLGGALIVYAGTVVVGTTMTIAGAATKNKKLIAAGMTTITTAPTTFLLTLPTPTP